MSIGRLLFFNPFDVIKIVQAIDAHERNVRFRNVHDTLAIMRRFHSGAHCTRQTRFP